jgi:hypothetical protein
MPHKPRFLAMAVYLCFGTLFCLDQASARTLSERCHDLFSTLTYMQRLPSLKAKQQMHSQLTLAGRTLKRQDRNFIRENFAQHLNFMAADFNRLHRGTGLVAIAHTNPGRRGSFYERYKDLRVEITLEKGHYPQSAKPKTYFENILHQTLKDDPVSRVIYQPLHPAMLESLGLRDQANRITYLGVKDLLSIDTIPSVFWHEFVHQKIFSTKEKKRINSPLFSYNGEISGSPLWARSGYLRENRFLSLSEVQTFWVTFTAQRRNLIHVLNRRSIKEYSRFQLYADLEIEVRETLRMLLHLRLIGKDIVTALEKAAVKIQNQDIHVMSKLENHITNIVIGLDTDGPIKNFSALETQVVIPEELNPKRFKYEIGLNAEESVHVAGVLRKRAELFESKRSYANWKLIEVKKLLKKLNLRSFVEGTSTNRPSLDQLLRISDILIHSEPPKKLTPQDLEPLTENSI